MIKVQRFLIMGFQVLPVEDEEAFHRNKNMKQWMEFFFRLIPS